MAPAVRNLAAMSQKQYDVLIIGGGINGSMIAWDAAMRGLKTALVEKEDFGYGTSSRSTRLIHGGLRYLEHFEFRLVREGLIERERLLQNAPHLVRPLPFITPIYKEDRHNPLTMKAGMVLYDFLSRGKSLPRHRMLSLDELARLEPGLKKENLRAGALYYDAQCAFPERLCVEHVLSAIRHGADVANYAEVESVRFSDAEKQVTVKDRLSGHTYTIKTKTVVNATGPWVDLFHEKAINESLASRLRLTKGIHIVVPSISNHAIVILAARDGRVFFVIPWQGYSLVGTTDTDFDGDLDRLTGTEEEIRYLMEETQRVFPQATIGPVYSVTSGVRPLVLQPNKHSTSAVSRAHAVVDHGEEGFDGLFSVLGGKITNHRRVAEETVDVVSRRLGRTVPCETRSHPTYGGEMENVEELIKEVASEGKRYGLDGNQAEMLVDIYGSKAVDVLDYCRSDLHLAQAIQEGKPEIWAQVVYGIDHEMVETTADFLFRRAAMGHLPGLSEETIHELASFIGKERRRDRDGVAADVRHTLDVMGLMHAGQTDASPGSDNDQGHGGATS